MRKILLLLIIIFLLFSAFFYTYILPNSTTGLFKIEKGENLSQITKNLKKEGYLKFGFPFYFYVLIKDKAADLKSGVYLLTSGDTIFTIADKIIDGKTYTIKITIPEGFNLGQISDELVNSDLQILDADRFNKFTTSNFKREFEFLDSAPDLLSLEGFLFPDTYYLYPRRDAKAIAKIFLANFDEKLTPELREEIKKQGKTIFEIMTMASLIEKEVRTPEDKKIVSGILWKRLENKMRLQVDATIAYITGKKTTKISFDELGIDSSYNTYKYPGLPKGPISNPGLDSIIAAIYPEDSDYWYYLSTPEGKTIFSRTLREHELASRKYLTR